MTIAHHISVPRPHKIMLLLAGLCLVMSPKVRAQEPDILPEEPAELTRRSPSPDNPNARLQTVVATSMGTAGGIVGGYAVAVAGCVGSGGGGDMGLDCIVSPANLAISVLGGGAGGYYGYKNNGTVVTIGGSVLGAVAGMPVALLADNSRYWQLAVPVVLLSATAGGYLGYRLWRVREAGEASYSLSPFWDQERAGLMVSGAM